MIEMIAVNMGIDTEQSSEYGLDSIAEVAGEWNTDLIGEDGLVFEKCLSPIQQSVHVIGSRELGWSFILLSVFPEIFEPWSSGHNRAFLRDAELGDGSVKHVDVIEKVDGCSEDIDRLKSWGTEHAYHALQAIR